VTRYAETTKVTPERSRAEIEATLKRYGADQFMTGWSGDDAVIGFRIKGMYIRLSLRAPKSSYGTSETKRRQAIRQRWRALLLVIKAKLEAVESGISTVEEEFLSHILIGDGQTFGEWARPQLEETYRTGLMPPQLPGLPAPAADRPRIVTAEVVE
jgi:hypothetical protein